MNLILFFKEIITFFKEYELPVTRIKIQFAFEKILSCKGIIGKFLCYHFLIIIKIKKNTVMTYVLFFSIFVIFFHLTSVIIFPSNPRELVTYK